MESILIKDKPVCQDEAFSVCMGIGKEEEKFNSKTRRPGKNPKWNPNPRQLLELVELCLGFEEGTLWLDRGPGGV